MLTICGRPLDKIASAVTNKAHYIALLGMVKTYPDFLDSFSRYLFLTGAYPAQVRVDTPTGRIVPTLYSSHDMLTVNEIFCRQDYAASSDTRVVVDLGSNIGISALYFLTRNHDCEVYLFEPLKRNVERLRQNCEAFQGRYALTPCAVGLENGMVNFGYEWTGRYGGIGLALEDSVEVQCLDEREVVDEVLAKHGVIDILKIDVEGFESALIRHLTASQLKHIRRIYAECPKFEGELPGFVKRLYGGVVQFVNEAH